MITAIRLAIGRRLVGLGFLIAPDAYWTMFEGAVKDVQHQVEGEK